MARLITIDGEEKIIHPADDKKGFTLAEVHDLIGCDCIDVVRLADGRRMVVQDDFRELPVNVKASVLFQEGRNARTGGSRAMRGTVVVGSPKEIR